MSPASEDGCTYHRQRRHNCHPRDHAAADERSQRCKAGRDSGTAQARNAQRCNSGYRRSAAAESAGSPRDPRGAPSLTFRFGQILIVRVPVVYGDGRGNRWRRRKKTKPSNGTRTYSCTDCSESGKDSGTTQAPNSTGGRDGRDATGDSGGSRGRSTGVGCRYPNLLARALTCLAPSREVLAVVRCHMVTRLAAATESARDHDIIRVAVGVAHDLDAPARSKFHERTDADRSQALVGAHIGVVRNAAVSEPDAMVVVAAAMYTQMISAAYRARRLRAYCSRRPPVFHAAVSLLLSTGVAIARNTERGMRVAISRSGR
jgi:hypothetical protein